jgi:nucleotide-binding universal stress UspA family protein
MQIAFKTILFTSNLSDTSRAAFCHAALLATQLKAKIILLHVIEITTISYENLLIKLFGKEKMDTILEQHRKNAQDALIGKISSRQMACSALDQFCRETSINNNQCDLLDYEIVIKEGDVVDAIIQEATEHNCDMIVMGASDGIISGTTIGANVKAVLDKSKIPTLVVAPTEGQERRPVNSLFTG